MVKEFFQNCTANARTDRRSHNPLIYPHPTPFFVTSRTTQLGLRLAIAVFTAPVHKPLRTDLGRPTLVEPVSTIASGRSSRPAN